jgi:hypothetical protein
MGIIRRACLDVIFLHDFITILTLSSGLSFSICIFDIKEFNNVGIFDCNDDFSFLIFSSDFVKGFIAGFISGFFITIS